MADFGAWEGRHEELLREAERERLARALRARRAGGGRREEPVEVDEGIEVRWGLLEDEAKVADLLQLNGMPRWLAFEERYVVAERDGRILAAVRYRTEKERLSLGLLIVDPWAEERTLAVALYRGAGRLARELDAREVIARPSPRADHTGEAGYRRRGRRDRRLDVSQPAEARRQPVGGMWRRLLALFEAPAVPFVGVLRK